VDYEPTGELALARRGIAALETLISLGDNQPTQDQRQTLAGWCGWGPLAKALNYGADEWHQMRATIGKLITWQQIETAKTACDTAFYTPRTVIRGMWDLMEAVGFTGGRLGELGCGSGRFMQATPGPLDRNVTWVGVEADKISAAIAQLVNPGAEIIQARLEKQPLRQSSFDGFLGNVPFSKQGVYDPNAPKGITSLHGYFLWRALNACRPGGIVCVVTSRWILDAATNDERDELAKLGIFLGALRLPSAALAPGGTRAVTDIVVFRRRVSASERHLDDRWLAPVAVPDGLRTTISAYFHECPERVIGAMADRGGDRYGMNLDVTLPDGQDLAVALDEAVQSLAGLITHAGLGWVPPRGDPANVDLGDAADGVDPACDGAFTLHDDGTITQQRDGRHHPVRADQELAALIRLKTAALALFAAEASSSVTLNAKNRIRQATLRLYQEYTAWFGYLGRSDLTTRPDPDGEPGDTIVVRSRPAKMGGFRQDPDWPTVLAVEMWDDDEGVGCPAPILLRPVGGHAQRKDHTGDPAEALALCLDRAGCVDLSVLADILQVLETDVPLELDTLIWEDPADPGTWLPADEYLSGNVRVKLGQAKAAAEEDEGRWRRHVAALEAVQPEDLGPDQINVQLGAPWLPTSVVADFIAAVLHVNSAYRDQITVRYEKYTSTWDVKASTAIRSLPAAKMTWGTTRVNAVNLIHDACNNTTPTVYDRIDEKDVKNQVETALAADKIRDLQEKFAEWWAEDPKRSDRLCALYNERFNATRVRTFDGSMLTFPGLSTAWGTPYASQLDMIWRNVCTGTTLCGHVVGAGKTFIAVATAMKMRELGFAKKPAMVVPNHLLEQTCAEARRYFPGAAILMVTKEDLNPARRRFFAAKCAARDWDLVVMTHQQWLALPVDPATQEAYFADLLDELDVAMEDPEISESRSTSKMLARKRRRLIAKMDALADVGRDGGLTFEQTLIDYAIIDEAHMFKNLEFIARAEGFNSTGSKRADDMLMKFTYLRDRSPDGRVGMMMTGTPISNALSELHVLFRYCAPHLLAEQDLVSFDAFAAQYIRYATSTEVAPDGGGFRSYRRPRLFVNLAEVRAMLWQFADIRTRNDLALDGPRVTVDLVACDGPPELEPFTAKLVERADKIRNGEVKPHQDNMLKVCGDGRAAALWMPLVGITPTAPGKVERCAANVARIYHQAKADLYPDPTGRELFHGRPGALQVVFCDLGTPKQYEGGVYDYLRDLLAHAGIPKNRIVFIHDAKSHDARKALFADCRNGKVSVLIGSTEKMGTGVNIQRRLRAIHHLDAPWRPSDLEQRDGRGDRPGNANEGLDVYRYATKGSFDAYMWQALERKKRFIDQVLCGDPHVREVEAVDNPQVLSYGQLKALATGQPLLLMLSEVNATIARLRNSSAGHKRSQQRMRFEVKDERASAERWTESASQLRSVAAKAADAAALHDEPVLRPDTGEKAVGAEAVAERVTELIRAARMNRDPVAKLGTYRGVYLTVEIGYRKGGTPVLTGLIRAGYWEKNTIPVSIYGGFQPKTGGAAVVEAFDRAIDQAEVKAAECDERSVRALAKAAEMEPYLDVPWDGKDELAAAVKRRAEIERDIDAQVKDSRKQPQPA
jgi:N12 class adenine-specific DNA methylase